MVKTLDHILSHTKMVNQPFFLIAGPCVLEDEEMGFEIARKVMEITSDLGIPYIFKASYKKANRSKLESFSGIGDAIALNALAGIREQLNVPVITDIHTNEEAYMAARHVDILQIPAFLCRQTELLLAAGKTGKVVNIKKGQFLSPSSMEFAVDKVLSTGNKRIMVTERGTTFGYGDLVVDLRGIPQMQEFGVPVVLDVTHSLQQPNQAKGVSGGLPHLIETMACAGIAAGADGLLIETHNDPENAQCDGEQSVTESQLSVIKKKADAIMDAIK